MNTIKKILVPTDFSGSAKKALGYVTQLIRLDKKLEVYFLHTLTNGISKDHLAQTEQELKQIEQQIPQTSKWACHCLIRTGNLIETILRTQQQYHIDLIVMGTAGLIENRAVAESNTSHLALEAQCPVLVVPEQAASFNIKHIALAIDLEAFDDSFALGIVHTLARWYNAKVHVLTINKYESDALPSKQKVEDMLEYYFDNLDYHYAFPYNADIEKGITNYIIDKKIDMLAILPRTHAKNSKPSEGRLIKLLTLHTKVPMLCVQ